VAGRSVGGDSDERVRRRFEKDLSAVTSRAYGELEHRPIEGFIHKFKLPKSQCYGRATFDLLRARVLAV
jgi:transposase